MPLNFLIPNPGTPYENYPVVEGPEALRTVGAFRLALDRDVAAHRDAAKQGARDAQDEVRLGHRAAAVGHGHDEVGPHGGFAREHTAPVELMTDPGFDWASVAPRRHGAGGGGWATRPNQTFAW